MEYTENTVMWKKTLEKQMREEPKQNEISSRLLHTLVIASCNFCLCLFGMLLLLLLDNPVLWEFSPSIYGHILHFGIFAAYTSALSWLGELKTTLSRHKGPIFSLKWNKKGDYLLTGSCDKTAIVWDVKAEEGKQQFEFHTGLGHKFGFRIKL